MPKPAMRIASRHRVFRHPPAVADSTGARGVLAAASTGRSSTLASMRKRFARLVPDVFDVLEHGPQQRGKTRIEPREAAVARAVEVDAMLAPDSAGPRRERDHAIGQHDGFLEVVR